MRGQTRTALGLEMTVRNALDSDEGSSIGGPEVETVALPPALQVTSGPETNAG